MIRAWLRLTTVALVMSAASPTAGVAQTERGPYARIAVLRPHDGRTVDFESGYIRHLAWHRQAGDSWTWYGWTVTFGERQRWFVYATFGHSAASLDASVSPADDERDNVLNVAPHAEFAGNAIYEYLPAVSRGSGIPSPSVRLELTTVDLAAQAGDAFERALAARRASLQDETLWYRLVAGGSPPRYVRLRPRPSLPAVLDRSHDETLPEEVRGDIRSMTIEILTLRPAMSLGIEPARR